MANLDCLWKHLLGVHRLSGDAQPGLHLSAPVPTPDHGEIGFEDYWAGAEKNTENSWSRRRQIVLDVLGNKKDLCADLSFLSPP